ncbi:MAG: hypothetical protein A2289_01315 [Deltaproteobacteria bacterium RIFOXYA12_FULL_58_15]|nr:MAG: hypothetical protein A2289_01315 [Deltaproteobacteria bacterium RIFOXYA12_FULL_58_15]
MSNTTESKDGAQNKEGTRGFDNLGLSQHLLDTLARTEYVTPTPIQFQAIPHVLAGKDLLGCAQTGTGKTAAFALPIIQRIMIRARAQEKQGGIQALVLAPTRELAAQIGASFEKYAGRGGPRQTVVFGGVSKSGQIQALRRGVEVLVATPGRLLDLMGDGVIRLDRVHTFVLDEADRMLDMGFINDVRRITKAVPENRQTLMFSATMPPEIRDLADRILKNPVSVAVDPVSSTVAPLDQSVYLVEKSSKIELLIELLRGVEIDRALVFTRTKHGANRVVKRLVQANFQAAAIHGNKSQSARVRALEDFKAGRIRIVVATDIAARGIDIKDLSHVINFDLPNEPESYVHRVGRTGRAGKTGIAISFCSAEERLYLKDIERLIRRSIEIRVTPKGLPRGPASPPRSRDNSSGSRATQPGQRNVRPGQRNARPGQRDARPGQRDARPGQRDARPGQRDARPASLHKRPRGGVPDRGPSRQSGGAAGSGTSSGRGLSGRGTSGRSSSGHGSSGRSNSSAIR